MNFDQAFSILIGEEGNYVNNPSDPGGETKFGISKRAFPTVDIAALTLEDAKALAKKFYWDPVGCDYMPDPLCFEMFDVSYNNGAVRAIKFLQQALELEPTGSLDSHTLQQLQASNPTAVAAKHVGYRLLFDDKLTTWPTFGRGWAGRIANILISF
jgi:lysozyme family protein